MQTMYEDEAITVRPNQDGYLLSDFQHTLGDLFNGLWFERCAAFYRHVDVRDRKFFSPHHGRFPKGCQQHTARGNNLITSGCLSPLPTRPTGSPCLSRARSSSPIGEAYSSVKHL